MLIEHDMGLVMQVSRRIVVLNFGKEIADGHARRRCGSDPAVIEAYLGQDDDGGRAADGAATDGEQGGSP